MKSSKLVLVIALAVTLVAATPALAKKAATDVDVTEARATGPDTARYEGKVSSKKGACEKGRRVKVIHDSDPPFTIGETETDEKGNWSLTGPYPPSSSDDRIVVKVSKSSKCKGASTSFDFYD